MDLITGRVVTRVAAGALGALLLGLAAMPLRSGSMARRWLTASLVLVGIYVGFRLTSIQVPTIASWRLLPVAILLVVGASAPMVLNAGMIDRRVGLLLLVISVGGVWVGPPENDHTLVLLGAFIGALLIEMVRAERPVALGCVVEYALVAWAALAAGAGQVHPTMGGLLCLGVLPFGLLWAGRCDPGLFNLGVAALLVGHCATVAVASRVYAAGAANVVGLLVALATMLIVVVMLATMARRSAVHSFPT